ncbi:hypothetical protein FGD67_05435 [Colwellia sp. M166]|uniref:hypothetical protein n=1 Tax=Colwellia sp. M166 TaxID=2583805 RepID=UPI00211F024C|nr:hypothetical protein [Colwellia sp. M166]UUO22685.1 hypothetical protein FGD67_05435 [Colwellia sp. M166]|tara:strand:+ start:894 stop:1421 length:528 start_codon:yes stop_codon:yes gene_type:complete
MKHILFTMILLVLSACGGGGGSDKKADDVNNFPDETESFTLQNIRFDSKDYYEGELVTVTKGTSFEVQWVSPTSASYKIDLYLSANDEVHSDNNKIVELKCGSTSFSLCPNATGEVQCKIDDSKLSCSIGSDFVGSANFLDENLSSLRFIIKGCDALSNCDLKTFNLSVQNNTGD